MERPLTTWERDVVTVLAGVDSPPGGPDPVALRESIPHLVVYGGCECGCPSIFVRDTRAARSDEGCFHYSNAVTPDGRIGLYLLVKEDAPYSVDVMLPPDLDGSEPEARPDPWGLVVTSPWEQ